jgi:hypothetical protein
MFFKKCARPVAAVLNHIYYDIINVPCSDATMLKIM